MGLSSDLNNEELIILGFTQKNCSFDNLSQLKNKYIFFHTLLLKDIVLCPLACITSFRFFGF